MEGQLEDEEKDSVETLSSVRQSSQSGFRPMLTFGLEGSAPPLAPMPKLAFHLCQRAKGVWSMI